VYTSFQRTIDPRRQIEGATIPGHWDGMPNSYDHLIEVAQDELEAGESAEQRWPKLAADRIMPEKFRPRLQAQQANLLCQSGLLVERDEVVWHRCWPSNS
jgi:hypothetical protein